jgi:hypothetical protein
MKEYGLLPGRYPAVVKSYSASRRTCRVELPGLTDGADVLPEAEIEYPIGDKSRAGANTTEIEITAGDTVWVAFIGGDPRYPVVTGYRNPQAGNSTDWRRWHHANMELLADALMRLIAQGDVTIQSATKITLIAPEIIADAPETLMTGNSTITGNNTVGQGLSVQGGGGAGSTVNGRLDHIGTMTSNGKVIDNTHTHSGVQSGSGNTGAVN